MIRDPKNPNNLKIKQGTTGKLLQTADGKFSIIVFTERQAILGKGAFGKCSIGILESSQTSNDQNENQKLKQSNHSIVVVKQIKKNVKDPSQEPMYKRQIQNLSLATKIPLISKNLVKCYPFDVSSQNNYYMVMQYCEGKSLDKLINKRMRNGKWFNFFEFLKIFSDIVNGYYPLNKFMIMHEDLKPQNIFIKGKQFKIGDFGLSFLMKGSKQFVRGGSLSYNGKQKYQRSKEPSNKSDMYAIGIILYRLFYGIHPYFDKEEFQVYKYYELNKLMEIGKVKNPKLKISKWDQIQIFLKFYDSRKIKKVQPFIKPPQIKEELKTYADFLTNLYELKIPQLIQKLIQKQINDRLSFTQLNRVLKQNKINDFFKFIEEIRQFQSLQIQIFDDLNEQGYNQIKLNKSFDELKNQICIQKGSQIEKRDLEIDFNMLKTAGSDKLRKGHLVRKYPKVFQLKSQIQEVNKITRLLVNIYEQLNQLDLKQFFLSLRENKSNQQRDNNESYFGSYFIPQFLINMYEGRSQNDLKSTKFQAKDQASNSLLTQKECDQNEVSFYQDKKIEVEFLVEKYLYAFLVFIQKQIESTIKKFSPQQQRIFYQQNVDFLFQLIQKNKQFLETELFIAHGQCLQFEKCQQELQSFIVHQFLDFFIIDKNNLVLVYQCLCILKAKDFIKDIKEQYSHKKQAMDKKRHQQEQQDPTMSQLQQFVNQRNKFTIFLQNLQRQNTIEANDQTFKSLKQFIDNQCKRNNIIKMQNID